MRMAPVAPRLALCAVVFFVSHAAAQNLAAVYPATLDYEEGFAARAWTTGPQHVWRLSSFSYGFGGEFAVSCGPAQVVFGVHETNVVWAVVLPNTLGRIDLAPAGEGELAQSVYLRFNPALVSDIFPPGTVEGRGDASQTLWGERVFRHKINSSWQADNQPVIPWKHSVVADVQTPTGPRRFFMVDTEAGTVKYEPSFESQTLPLLKPITGSAAERAFDAIWTAFDEEYPMFGLKPEVSWTALREEYAPRVAGATTTYEAAALIGEMLAHLEDLHVWVRVGDEFVPGYTRERPLNANWSAVETLVSGFENTRHNLAWGRRGTVGYVNVYGLSDPTLVETFDRVLERLRNTTGLVLDLRFNGGGDETLGRAIAGRFAERAHVYSSSRYRNGPAHDALGPAYDRTFEPRGPWRYEKPVVVLFGQRTMSSAESFALMLAQCANVTTMGDRTAGSSANPRRVETESGIVANLPRWLDLKPDGTPLEVEGVTPDVPIDAAPDAFSGESDPVFEAAVERLTSVD